MISVKSGIIRDLFPGERNKELRMLAYQMPEIGKAVATFCNRDPRPEFDSHFAVARKAVLDAYSSGRRHHSADMHSRRGRTSDAYAEASYYSELHGTDFDDELAVEEGLSDFCPGCGADLCCADDQCTCG